MRRLIGSGYDKCLDLVSVLFREAAIGKLRESSAKCETIEDYVNLAFSFRLGLIGIRPFLEIRPFLDIKPSQIKWEISQLMKILAELAPKKVLEIGTARGGTLFLWSKVVPTDGTLISIDLPGGYFGGGYPRWKVPFYESFGLDSQKIYPLRADSHDENTLSEVESILGDSRLDFLFIDGDHSDEGVKKDFEMYGKLVRRGGIIAFHDIVPVSYENRGVPDYWIEIKQNFPHKEIVRDWNQEGHGIGIISNFIGGKPLR